MPISLLEELELLGFMACHMHEKTHAHDLVWSLKCMRLQLSYLRIRHQKPKLVWEISPNWGYSTIYLLSALKDNEAGQLISFDTWDGPGQNDCVQQVS